MAILRCQNRSNELIHGRRRRRWWYICVVIRESFRTYFLQTNMVLLLLPESTVRRLYEYILVRHILTTFDKNMLHNSNWVAVQINQAGTFFPLARNIQLQWCWQMPNPNPPYGETVVLRSRIRLCADVALYHYQITCQGFLLLAIIWSCLSGINLVLTLTFNR